MAILKANLLKNGVLIGGCLMVSNLLAAEADSVSPTPSLPVPGVSVYGMGGNGWTAIGDAMAPLFGQSTRFVYLDPQFYYHSNQDGYTGSVGAGLRRLTERAGILGAYVFGDYDRSNGHSFWFVSPGVERLGQMLDFSANGYIPVSTQRINTGIEFADQAGDTSQVTFSGHTQYDALVNTFTSTGYGGDAQVGVHLPFLKNSEIYFGGYYFAPKDTNTIGGGAVRLQVPINRYINVLFSEAYDSEYHNTVKAGLTFWFGGRHTDDGVHGDLVERMVAPIQRNLVIVAGGSHTGQPVVSDFTDTGQTAIELQNISFFVPSSGPETTSDPTLVTGDGSYENPYVGMSQANVDNGNAQNNRNFYIDSGTYTAVYSMADPDYIVLNNDQLYGRQNNFTKAAQGLARPVITFSNGGFEVPAGDVNDSFTGLQLTGANINGFAGIWIDHDNSPLNQTVTINNTNVQLFGDGMDILNNSDSALTVTLNNSWVGNNNGYGELYSPFQTLGGIAAVNAGAGTLQLNINHSIISNNIKSVGDPTIAAVGGLAVVNESDGTMTVKVNHSWFSENNVAMNNDNNDVDRTAAAGGLAAVNQGSGTLTVDANYSTFSNNTVSMNNTSGQTEIIQVAGGLAAVNESAGTMLVNANHSILSGNSFFVNSQADFSQNQVDAMGGLAAANQDTGTLTVNVKHSTLSANTVNVDSGDSGNDSIKASGGLAVVNNSSTGTTTINADHSAFSGNMFLFSGGGRIEGDVVGGLAAANLGFEGAEMTVNVNYSTISNNTISSNMTDGTSFFSGESFDAMGGLAVCNLGHNSTTTVDVNYTNVSNNTISFNNNEEFSNDNFYAIGGVAILSNDGTTTVDIHHSNISGNVIDFNNDISTEQLESAGGLALASNINQQDGTLIVNVSHSSISQNVISFNDQVNFATIYTVGGLSAFNSGNGTMILNVDHSLISKNVISFGDNDSPVTIYSAGGLAVTNFSGSGTMDINVSHSTISGNSASFDGSAQTVSAAGGLAVTSTNSLPMTVNVDSSVITANSPGGIDVDGGSNVAVIVNRSIVAWNSDFALTANGGATIDVTKPIFFNGIVNANSGSTITFQGIPAITGSGVHVICLPLAPCQIVS